MKIHWLLLGGALLAAPVAWYALGKLHRFAYWIGRHPDAELQALAADGFELDRLTVAPEVELVGLVRRPRTADARWVLFVPGNSPSLLAGFRDIWQQLVADRDIGVAFWAYRGFDASGGTPTPAALRADLDAQWARLTQLGATPARTEVWGYSLGTPLAVRLVADLPTPPRRLVLVAAAPRIPVMPYGWFGRLRSSDVFDCGDAPPRVRCPVCMFHGTGDAALPIAGARELAAQFGDRVTLRELPGVAHSDLWPAVLATRPWD